MHDYRELKHGLDLDHFEGRSYPGWHRHAALAALAQAFIALVRANPRAPCAGMTLYQAPRELHIDLALILDACPRCGQPLTLGPLATTRTPGR